MLASLAQAESESISANVRQGIHYIESQGLPMICGKRFLGYDCPEKHKLEINPEQARLVRRVFRLFLEGYSPNAIAAIFTAEEVRGVTEKTKWYSSTISYILHNEKYCGDLLIQKTYTADPLTHKQLKNEGRYPQYFIEDNHDPIIPREVYLAVQGESRRRSQYHIQSIGKYRVYCGSCGTPYRLDDETWRSQKKGTCACRKIQTGDLDVLLEQAAAKIRRQTVIAEQKRLEREIDRLDEMIRSSDEQQSIMEERLGAGVAQGETEYLQRQIEKHQMQRNALHAQRSVASFREIHTQLWLHNYKGKDPGEACSDKENFYDITARETDRKKLIESVCIFPDKIEVTFLSGVSVSVEAAGRA